MNELKIFESAEFGKIRIVMIADDPWLVGKDAAVALGYSNPRKALADHVDEEDKGVTKCDTLGGAQEMTVINESGLYSLVISSKLPTAKKFKHWITSEVLPSIRKHGAYMTPETIEQVLLNPDTIIKLATTLKEEQAKRKELEAQTKALEGKIEEDKPKVLFADAVSASKTSILVGELAKLLKQNGVSIGQNRMFKWLRSNGYLIKRHGTDYNMPTQRAMEMGLFEIKERTITQPDGHTIITKTPKITGAGQEFFVNIFLGEKKAE